MENGDRYLEELAGRMLGWVWMGNGY